MVFTFNNENVYCITVDIDSERATMMRKKLDKLNISFSFWLASLPSDVVKSTLKFHDILTQHERACSLSHWGLWNYLASHDTLEYIFILEDDALFKKDFHARIEQINHDLSSEELERVDYIHLNASSVTFPLNKWVKADNQWYSAGYILLKRGAVRLLELYRDELISADRMLIGLQCMTHSYTIYPWLVIQGDFSSTIDGHDNFYNSTMSILRQHDVDARDYD